MTHRTDDGIEAFRAGFSGQALTPGHPDYDRSRAVWNGAIDRKPAVIACCTTAEQVADAIRFARGERARDRDPRRRSQLRRARGLRWRADDPPRRDERRRRRSRGAACGVRRRRDLGRRRRGDAAARARDPRRLHQPHRHRGTHARRRHRLAHQEGRALLRQPRRRRDGDRRLAHRPRVEGREPRPVLGAARRRRQLRRRHVVRVRAPPRGPAGQPRAVLLRSRERAGGPALRSRLHQDASRRGHRLPRRSA